MSIHLTAIQTAEDDCPHL